MLLEVGTKAPDFTLPDKDGNLVSLADSAGKKVVLYFYPKDNTPGCTRQACAFGARYKDFEKRQICESYSRSFPRNREELFFFLGRDI